MSATAQAGSAIVGCYTFDTDSCVQLGAAGLAIADDPSLLWHGDPRQLWQGFDSGGFDSGGFDGGGFDSR